MPVDIVEIVREEVTHLDIGTGEPPAFVHGPKSFQNWVSDKTNSDNAIVYLDEPITSDDTSELSGAYTESFPLRMFFAKKIPSPEMFDFDGAQRSAMILMRHLRFQFVNRIRNRTEIYSFNGIRTIEQFNVYDKNVSGVAFYINLVFQTGEAVCIDEDEVTLGVFPSVYESEEPFALTGGSPAGGTYFANGVRVTGLFDPSDYGPGDVVIRYIGPTGDDYAEQLLTILEDVEAVTTCENPNALNFGEEGECIFPVDAPVVFETDAMKVIETQVGANLIETDIAKIPAMYDWALSLNLQVLYWFTLHSDENLMDNSLAATVTSFANDLQADIIVYYPVAKISTPPFTKLDWLISTLNPVAVALDAESQVSDATTYKARAAAAIAHINGIDPTIKTILDDALVYRTNPLSLNWNTQLADFAGTEIGRQYIQLSDQIIFDTDMAENLVKFNNYRTVTFFDDLANFLSRLPLQRKKAIMQWHTEDTGQSYVSDKPLGNYIIGETVRLILSNTESFEYLLWMTLGNLIKQGVPQPEYHSIKRLIPAFTGFTHVMPVSIPFAGCDALGFWDGADEYGLLINNQLADEHTILASEIGIPGKTVSINFTRDTGFASSWDDVIQNEVEVEADITVRGNSVSFITFEATGGLTPATHTITPSDTDPLITLEATYPHYAYVPSSPNGKLLLYFPGSGSHPSGCQLWMQTAQDEGYHVLGINYYNKLPGAALCNLITAPEEATYLDLYSQEILFGGDLSPLTEVSVSNSVENRLKKLLTYLHTNFPAEGWDTFLVAGVVQWNLITASGHSQGAGHAAFLGKYRALGGGVLMFSGPRDVCHTDDDTVWDSGSFLTDISKYRAFSHFNDNYDKQLPTWTDMGIELPPVDVETDPVEANWGKTLITSRTNGIANFHKCTLTDAVTPLTAGVPDFLPVWIHLLNE